MNETQTAQMAACDLPFSMFVVSDVHLERLTKKYQCEDPEVCPKNMVAMLRVAQMPDAEVCVLAGDIGHPCQTHFVNFIKACAAKYKHTLYVPGNHDFWTGLCDEEIRDIVVGAGGVYLNNDTFHYKGVVFFGTTLWTDLDLFGEPIHHAPTHLLNDFRMIPDLTVEVWLKKHHDAIKQLQDVMDVCVGKHKLVVVTHHAPSPRCIPTIFKGDATNVFFASNLNRLMLQKNAPTAWIFGHTHFPLCQTMGNTFVMTNPLSHFSRDEDEHLHWMQPQCWQNTLDAGNERCFKVPVGEKPVWIGLNM